MVFVETPTNPVMMVTDLKAVSDIAHAHGARVVCDNTFMSPYLQRPMEFGVDIVVHSTTKFLNGHSDGVGAQRAKQRRRRGVDCLCANGAGAILSPFDSWLVLRGTETLALRMEQHDKSGRAVAAFLEDHPKVQKIYYPGSKSHKQHELAARQPEGLRQHGVLSMSESFEAARKVLESTKLCTLAESWAALRL
jgi:cystathionine beta-lyase/cystathionine gamma-synthase